MSEDGSNSCNDDGNSTKSRTRLPLTVDKNLKIIRLSEAGESSTSIGSSYNTNPATIRPIVKAKHKIKGYSQNPNNGSSKKSPNVHATLMDEMERSLALWIEDMHQKDVVVSSWMIRRKARSLYEDGKARLKLTCKGFEASDRWYDRFRLRHPSITEGPLYIVNKKDQKERDDPDESKCSASDTDKNSDYNMEDTSLVAMHDNTNSTENEFDAFSNHVAVQLKQMPLYDALTCQNELLSLLTKIRLKILSRISENSSRLQST